MQKIDFPVYVQYLGPLVILAWPTWLEHCENQEH